MTIRDGGDIVWIGAVAPYSPQAYSCVASSVPLRAFIRHQVDGLRNDGKTVAVSGADAGVARARGCGALNAHVRKGELVVFELGRVDWRKSSFTNGNDCVTVGRYGDMIAVRDSKNPDGDTLRFTAGEWAAFLAGVKAGEFDDLIS